MSTETKTYSEPCWEHFQPYRAISKAAVLSLLLAPVSLLLGLLVPAGLVLAVGGVLLGIAAVRNIRRYPHELTGRIPALLGLTLCGLVLGIGTTVHAVVYITEVPEGHQRVHFADLQPHPGHPELPVPPRALELDGQKVFIKGYVYPDGQQTNIRQFVLVPDMGTCCFGGQPKLTDMVEVTLQDPHRVAYSYRKRSLAGVLRVDTQIKPIDGLQGVYYQLDADYVK